MSEPSVPVIVEPSLVTAEDPQQIINEISAVLRKYGYVIAAVPGKGIGLAKIVNEANMQALVVAEILEITPRWAKWRRIDMKVPTVKVAS